MCWSALHAQGPCAGGVRLCCPCCPLPACPSAMGSGKRFGPGLVCITRSRPCSQAGHCWMLTRATRAMKSWAHSLACWFAAGHQACGTAGGHRQVCVCAQLAPQLRHAFAASGHRHSHGARVAGSFRRFDKDDLHPCAQGGSGWHGQPFGFTASGLSRHHNLTGIPRPAICCLACPTVNSP